MQPPSANTSNNLQNQSNSQNSVGPANNVQILASDGIGMSNRQNLTEGTSTNNSSRPTYQNFHPKNDPSFNNQFKFANFNVQEGQSNNMFTQQEKRPQTKGGPGGRIQPFSNSQEQPNFQNIGGANSQAFNFTGGPQAQQQQPSMQYIMNCHQESFKFNQRINMVYQISPERAPLVYKQFYFTQLQSNDKRPFTASNSNEVTAKSKRQYQIYKQNRRNSKGAHHKNPNQLNPQNYQGSKTHSSGFGLGKYGSNQGLETNSNILAQPSVINTHLPQAQGLHNNQIKMAKIKPTKASMKEKEQLYEESIKLKMQVNTFKEENTKLKTKVKQLENEINKKEKAMEDIFTQNLQQQQQQYHKPTNSNTNLAPINQTVQKIHSETFLVMSLKKQIKELKMDLQKREEELEASRKNLKNTKVQELEIEVKTYRDESMRLRYVIDDLMKQGGNHPMYQAQTQDTLKQQENALGHQSLLIQKLQKDNLELSQLLKQRDDEIEKIDVMVKELSDKHRKEMVKEQSKAKKSVRNKEQEIQKLKVELTNVKKENQGIQKTDEKEKPKDQNQAPDQTRVLQNQVNLLQRKLKDSNSEAKAKSEKVTEQEQVITKLQDRLQQKLDELAKEQKKNQDFEKQIKQMQEEKSQESQNESEKALLKEKCKEELSKVALIGKRDKISRELISYKIKNNLREVFPNPSLDLVNFSGQFSEPQIYNIIEGYTIPRQNEEQQILKGLQVKTKKCQQSLGEGFTLEDTQDKGYLSISQIKEVVQGLELQFVDQEYEYISYQYLNKDLTGIDYNLLLNDLKQQSSQSQTKKKSSRPLTAKVGTKSQDNLQSKEDLNKIEEDEDSYQEDFDQNEKSKRKETGEESDEAEEVKPKRISPQHKPKKAKSDEELEPKKPEALEEGKYMDEEEMLDIAEHCFIKIAEKMIESNRSVRGIFTKFSIPEQFPDGSILELMSPISFLEGIKELGLQDLSEMEAACLLRVLTKPELDSAIILNELVLIMENFGVIDNFDDDDEDDYEPDDEDEEGKDSGKQSEKNDDVDKEKKDKPDNEEKGEDEKTDEKQKEGQKRKIQLNFDQLEEKGLKILQKLARFLLERYMHPREFFGPAIYKQLVKTKKKENNVDILQTKDFYLKLKLAGIRKTVKEVDNLNKFLCLDTKYSHLLYVKKVVKALEEVAQGEQLKMQEEMQDKINEEGKRANEDLRDMNSAGMITGGPPHLMGGPPSDHMMPGQSYGPGGMGTRLPPRAGFDMMGGMMPNPTSKYMGGYGQLNTIEEEKHETQTSNYFREGDSERDDSRMNQSNQFKTSKMLAELGNESHEFVKSSPDSRHSKFKNSPTRKNDQKEEIQEFAKEEEDEVNHLVSKDLGQQIQVIDQQPEVEDEEYEYDEYEEDPKKQKSQEVEENYEEDEVEEEEEEKSPRIESMKDQSIKDMKSVNSEIDEEVPQEELNTGQREQEEDNVEQSSDYEF